jgi:hypothetical protein
MVYLHYVGLWQLIVLYFMKPKILFFPGDSCIGKEISSFCSSYMVWLVYQNLMMALVEKLKHVAIVNKRIFLTSKVVLAEERKVFLLSFHITFSSVQQFEEQKVKYQTFCVMNSSDMEMNV